MKLRIFSSLKNHFISEANIFQARGGFQLSLPVQSFLRFNTIISRSILEDQAFAPGVTEKMEEKNASQEKIGRKRKKAEKGALQHSLDMMCKKGDTIGALQFYDQHCEAGTFSFYQYHYNILLHLCASAVSGSGEKLEISVEPSLPTETISYGENQKNEIIQKGMEILQAMRTKRISINEATLTSAARIAAAQGNGTVAFDYVLEMEKMGIEPKLRSYGPALFTLCRQNDEQNALRVYEHLLSAGVDPSEDELAALLRVCAQSNSASRVYDLLHALRNWVDELQPETLSTIEKWFNSDAACSLEGREDLTKETLLSAVESKGGGYHGLGWLGKGPWKTSWAEISKDSICSSCGEKLVTIDLDAEQTESFVESVSRLAQEREQQKSEFVKFQAWLDINGPFEAVVDAANIGHFNQNFSGGGFSFEQISDVVDKLKSMSPSGKLPLVLLHNRRTKGGPADSPLARSLLNYLRDHKAFYATPRGSNDDWYWLYAAVKNKALMVTNDEMRDHLFQLLGRDFFPVWKERHQVHYSFDRNGAVLHLPPPYSAAIQESSTGTWHFPQAKGEVISIRKWLCASRPRKS